LADKGVKSSGNGRAGQLGGPSGWRSARAGDRGPGRRGPFERFGWHLALPFWPHREEKPLQPDPHQGNLTPTKGDPSFTLAAPALTSTGGTLAENVTRTQERHRASTSSRNRSLVHRPSPLRILRGAYSSPSRRQGFSDAPAEVLLPALLRGLQPNEESARSLLRLKIGQLIGQTEPRNPKEPRCGRRFAFQRSAKPGREP